MLEDRERELAEGAEPAVYGRRQAFEVARALREKGPVKVPREFVFMDRAAIGLGGVFLHLNARLNYYRLFNKTIENFALADVAERQRIAFQSSAYPCPTLIKFECSGSAKIRAMRRSAFAQTRPAVISRAKSSAALVSIQGGSNGCRHIKWQPVLGLR